MGIAAIKIKIMPIAVESNLDSIEKKVKTILLEKKALNVQSKKQAIAFGLNALIFLFAWQEDVSTDDLLDSLRKIQDVNSAEIIDFRRAFG